jgi:molybdate transport system substrate-binding protein
VIRSKAVKLDSSRYSAGVEDIPACRGCRARQHERLCRAVHTLPAHDFSATASCSSPRRNRAQPIELKPGALTRALGDGRLAVANVAAVPAGKYGRAALQHLGLWGEVSNRLAQAENVRAALAFVARGEAPLGIVYETDAKADPKVSLAARFPETSHPPIVYPVAVTTAARSAEAGRFLDALRSPTSAATFAREGFLTLD